MNVVLISRSRDKLLAVASDIGETTLVFHQQITLSNDYKISFEERRFNVQTLIIDVDFTQELEIYDRIAKDIEGLEIGVLVNNVGMSYKYPEYLAEVYKSS